MALLSDYTAGTVSISGTTVTGVGTGWQTAGFQEGDWFLAEGYAAIVESVNSETELTVVAWAGPSITGGEYRLRYMSDGSRASAQARQLINMIGGSGSLEALAAISGVPGGIPYFTGPGTMGLLSQADITQGARYDVQVDTLAERDAYDSQPEGFAVLVNDIGDGRAAIYSRVGSVGNWTDPAYITGPIGPLPNVTVGGTSTGAPGTDADVVATPTVDGVELDFVIPRGRGITWRGEYDPGESYVLDDGVSYNGSTFIAIQEVPLAEPPSEVSAYWDVVAVKGEDGTGTGDVKGPSGGVTDGHVVVFDGTTGKLIRSAGKAPFSGDYGDLDNRPTLGSVSEIDLPVAPEGKLLDDSGNWIDPPEGRDFVGFKANKNGVDQTGVASATATKVTFVNEVFDEGGHYDEVNSRWVPPAGKCLLSSGAGIASGVVDGSRMYVQLYKNGVVFASTSLQFGSNTASVQFQVTTIDEATGTDYYEVYVFIEGSGSKSLLGSTTSTFFSGVML